MALRCRRRWERRCRSVGWSWPTARLPGMSAVLLEWQLAALSWPLLRGVRAPRCCCTRCAERMKMVAASRCTRPRTRSHPQRQRLATFPATWSPALNLCSMLWSVVGSLCALGSRAVCTASVRPDACAALVRPARRPCRGDWRLQRRLLRRRHRTAAARSHGGCHLAQHRSCRCGMRCVYTALHEWRRRRAHACVGARGVQCCTCVRLCVCTGYSHAAPLRAQSRL